MDINRDADVPAPRQAVLNIEHEMLRQRLMFAPIFKAIAICVMILIAITIILTFATIFFGSQAADERLLYARLMQITLGMILGSACVFFGVIVSWLGITSSYTFGASGETHGSKGNLNMENVTPGIILIICGAIIIGASLYKPIDYNSKTTIEVPGAHIQETSKDGSPLAP